MSNDLPNLKSCDISKDMRLLLLCSLNDITQEKQIEIRELASCQIDWNQFLDLAVKNRTYPVVYKNLAKIQIIDIDNNILNKLEKKCKENQMNLIRLTAELIRVMELFEKQGVRAISLKGPILARSLYGDISLRTSKDLDILINLEDIETAETILVNGGYEKEGIADSLSAKQKDILNRANHHIIYFNKKLNIEIELHWRYFYESYNFRFEELWASKIEAEIFSKRINVLSAEENFLFLAFHGSKHAWKRLRWLCDICEMMLKNDLNWEYIKERANEHGISHMIGQALILSNMFFRTELHSELFDFDGTHNKACKLASMAMPFILHADGIAEMPGHSLYLYYKRYLFVWHIGASKKFGFIRLQFRPTEPDFEKVQFKDRFFFMYFLTRPFLKLGRLFKSAGK